MNRSLLFLIILLLSLCGLSSRASVITISNPDSIYACDTINMPDILAVLFSPGNQEFPILAAPDSVKHSNYKLKKRIAAVLAFPFPFGLLGLHRVFLGTKPYIPFVYIGTLGGCFLILPIIDFVAILSANEETFKAFENNPRVFMWTR